MGIEEFFLEELCFLEGEGSGQQPVGAVCSFQSIEYLDIEDRNTTYAVDMMCKVLLDDVSECH